MLLPKIKKSQQRNNSVIPAQSIQKLKLIFETWALSPVTGNRCLNQKLCIWAEIVTLQQTGGAV